MLEFSQFNKYPFIKIPQIPRKMYNTLDTIISFLDLAQIKSFVILGVSNVLYHLITHRTVSYVTYCVNLIFSKAVFFFFILDLIADNLVIILIE